MTGIDVAATRAALAPLCQALRDDAREETRHRLAEADGEVARLLADAHTTAEGILAEARAAGIADGVAEATVRRARDRRIARTAQLHAQQVAYERLRQRVAERIADWYARPEVRSLLADQVRSVLGPDAVVSDAPGGGVTGTAEGRRLDLDVNTVTAGAIEALGADVERLWSP